MVLLMQLTGLWRQGECVLPHKNNHALVGGFTIGYISILWNVLGIPLSGEMLSLEKRLVFFDCYRLVSVRTSSCKTLLQCIIWQFSMQFSVKEGRGGGSGGCGEGLEIARLKVFITVGLVLDVSSYHMKILDSACGMLAQWEVDQSRWFK